MLRRIAAAIVVLVMVATALGQTLVVYPFSSRDGLLGTAVADRVALAFEESFEVYGPVVAPSLVPPLPIGAGFLNLTEFLDGDGVASRTGSSLLRGAVGADWALSGTVELAGDTLTAHAFLSGPEGTTSFSVRSAVDDPSALVRRLVAATATHTGEPLPSSSEGLDLSSEQGQLAQVLALLAAGLVDDARAILEEMVILPGDRAAELLAALRMVEAGGMLGDPALLATIAINSSDVDEERALAYFAELAARSDLPAAGLWSAVLHSSLGDRELAQTVMEGLPAGYEYGAAALVTMDSAPEERLEVPSELRESEDVAALLALAIAAGNPADVALEKELLSRLGRVAPFFTYPFERLSFIAFDEEEPLAAAQALAVAVELAPDSDLYWTNLGWAYYLLGFLERSEEASLRAVELNPDQYIALYNLGLARVVTGRLGEGLEAYRAALRLDPEVDDAAIDDLEQALLLYPGEPAINYALGLLYESEGRRAAAAEEYRRFLSLGGDDGYRADAEERAERLSAPPPPIQLTDGLVTIGLGPRHLGDAPFHPGDPLYPRFEVYTPGDELPQDLHVSLRLVDAAGADVLSQESDVEVPRGAIGFVIDRVELRLPADLPAGTYRADVLVTADSGREAGGSVHFEVAGEPQLLRQLVARNLSMQGLANGQRLFGPEHLSQPEVLLPALVQELRATAEAARQAIPAIEEGRFAGMDGGEAFETSTEQDVADFLVFLVDSGAVDQSFVFVEAYAQWLMDGTPTDGSDE